MTESITVKFDKKPNDIVQVTLDYGIESIDPEVVIEALYDLAREEEESWLRWCEKQRMEEALRSRRN